SAGHRDCGRHAAGPNHAALSGASPEGGVPGSQEWKRHNSGGAIEMKTRASFLIAIVWAALMQSYATTSAVPQPESPDTTAGPVSIQTGDASQHSAAEGTTHQTNGVKDLPRRHNKLSKAKHLPLPSHVRAFKTSTPINPRQSGAVKSGIDGKRVETGTANKAIPV